MPAPQTRSSARAAAAMSGAPALTPEEMPCLRCAKGLHRNEICVRCAFPGDGTKCQYCAEQGKPCQKVPDDYLDRVAGLVLAYEEIGLGEISVVEFVEMVGEFKVEVESSIRFRRKQGVAVEARTSVPTRAVDVDTLRLYEQRRIADALEEVSGTLKAILAKLP